MNPKSYQLFAELLESHINEASTALSLIGTNPGGQEVIKTLHKDMSLAHDIGYKPVEKVSWSELKEPYHGAWVIIKGTTGTGAIRAKGGSYEAVASSGAGVDKLRNDRGGNILDFLKGKIGKLQKFYVGQNTTYVRDIQQKRSGNKDTAGTPTVTQDTLIAKFQPLWARAITAAIADAKGHVANMIKNDAFKKAQRKLNHIENLQSALENMEAGSRETPDFIRNAVNLATLMTASHYYPETTGNITSSRYGRGHDSQFDEGPRQLLKDIANGDQKKLGTVLAFFKRALITG